MEHQADKKGHSENYFGEYRDFWWNRGFLDLMAARLNLKQHRTLLDVGCGMCHWSKLLLPYLADTPQVSAVDNDPKWSKDNPDLKAYFERYQAQFVLRRADAHALPFEDGSFDIVTCQTLLIHVKDPALVLSEMKRVLKPGGTILCVEPNNVVQNLTKSSLSADDTIEEVLDHVKYALICERGKKILGHGDNSIGDLLPGMLASAGFGQIEIRLSDKAIAMYPPYDTKEQVATLRQWAEGGAWYSEGINDKAYFQAAGENYLEFYETYHKKYLHSAERLVSALVNEKYHAAGGAMMYLVSGIK